ncbi:beta-lactamase-like protein [Papiliotrema laurentii]|uniref:Cleavage and polyadenylation specificity factor subunit 2 n=1 Tax=Papiliotrema laurentii TaxID=5418 RepID=A0AAD9L6U0_PAPLA|nr:beta-lactamase-like protein [Papiliotrema laurentii]
MITLTPLSSSAASSSSSEPVCFLLELDEARILLDLGQRDYRASAQQTSWEYEEKVRELAPTLSLVLLSHSPSTYLSLYPYARAHWGLTCPVYATQPTVEMGRVVCLAEVESWRAEHAIEDIPASPAIKAADGDDEMNDGEEEGKVVKLDKGKKPLRGPFVPTVEEVHEAFDWVKAIRYNQPLHLGGELSHLLLTPFPSGHTLGGTLFKIRSPTSGTVLYAVGINHTGERHLDGMIGGQGGASGYAEEILRPDLLIVEGGRSQVVNAKRRDRETALLDLITSTLNSTHSVLLPVDPAPRLLELLVLLDQHWTFKLQPNALSPLRPEEIWPFPLCLVSRTAQDMVNFARSLIEWMGGVVRDSGEDEVLESRRGRKGRKGRKTGGALGSEYGALDFRHVKFFSSPEELAKAYSVDMPKLILAIPPSLSHGPSRWLFTSLANREGNVVLLTNRGEDGTLARDLYDRWESQQDDSAKWGKGRIGHMQDLEGHLQIEMNTKVPLEGAELEAHLEAERFQKEKDQAHQAALDRSRRMLEADDLDTDSESGSDAGSDVADGIIMAQAEPDPEERLQMSFDIYVKGQQTRVGRTGVAGEMARFRMFPFIEGKRRKIDEYGESIDLGLWIRRGREIEEEGETEEVREKKRRKQEEEEKQKAAPEVPSKFVSQEVDVNLKASIFYVGMEGVHDGEAIKRIISDLQPRKMILVRSTPDATEALLVHFKTTNVTKDVFTPATGEEVKIGEHIASYSIMLGDSITSRLAAKWSKFEGYEVAMVDGQIAFSAGSTVPTVESLSVKLPPREVKPEPEIEPVSEEPAAPAEEQHEGVKPSVDGTADTEVTDGEVNVKSEPEEPMPEITTIAAPRKKAELHQSTLPGSLFVGDLRLANLKHRLSTLDPPISAEFAGEGILICGAGVHKGSKASGGSIVAVRKLAAGEIVLEGAVGRTYDIVRKELYKGFARVVAA